MSLTRKLLYEPIRSINSATFTGSYQLLGTDLDNACSIIKIVNNSNVAVTISTDATDDHDFLPANSYCLYDVTSDSPAESGSIFIEKGTQYYIKGSAGVGLVYLVAQYVQQR